MFQVPCPECGLPVEIGADAVGPERTDLWNVALCEWCDLGFDYDDDEVREVPVPEVTPEVIERLRQFHETGQEPESATDDDAHT